MGQGFSDKVTVGFDIASAKISPLKLNKDSLGKLITEMNNSFESVIDSQSCTLRFAIVPDVRNQSALWKLFIRVDCIKFRYEQANSRCNNSSSRSVATSDAPSANTNSQTMKNSGEHLVLIEMERYRFRLNDFRNVYNAIMSLVVQHTGNSRPQETRKAESNLISFDSVSDSSPYASASPGNAFYQSNQRNACSVDSPISESLADQFETNVGSNVIDSVAVGELDDNRVCCVCMDRRTDLVLDCGHAYCQVCMDEWTSHAYGLSTVYECVQCRIVQSADDAWLLTDDDCVTRPGSAAVSDLLLSTSQRTQLVVCSAQFADLLTNLPARFGSPMHASTSLSASFLSRSTPASANHPSPLRSNTPAPMHLALNGEPSEVVGAATARLTDARASPSNDSARTGSS